MKKFATLIIFVVCITFTDAEILSETEGNIVPMDTIGSRLAGDKFEFTDYFENLVKNKTYYMCPDFLNS